MSRLLSRRCSHTEIVPYQTLLDSPGTIAHIDSFSLQSGNMKPSDIKCLSHVDDLIELNELPLHLSLRFLKSGGMSFTCLHRTFFSLVPFSFFTDDRGVYVISESSVLKFSFGIKCTT